MNIRGTNIKTSFRYILGIITIMCCSCATERLPGSVGVFSVDYHNMDEPVRMTSFLKPDYKLIPLDCPTKEAMIGTVSRLLAADGKIFIVDSQSDRIVAFTDSGRFVASTQGMIGHGHNEYLRMTDAVLDAGRQAIYMFCDAPYCIFTLDLNLNFVSRTDLDFYASSAATDGNFVYCLAHDNGTPWKKKVLSLPLSDLSAKPSVILDTDKGVKGLSTIGESLSSYNGHAYACLPFDNRIYQLDGGRVSHTFVVDFGRGGVNDDELKSHPDGYQFSKRNEDKNWMVTNIAMSDSTMMFNTNTNQTFIANTSSSVCNSYQRLSPDILPVANSRWITVSGKSPAVAQVITPKTIRHYVEQTGRNADTMDAAWRKACSVADSNMYNPVLVIYYIK